MTHRSIRRDRKGSVLIVAMLLAAIIAVSLGSYINLAGQSARLADRSFFSTQAVNLAEMGLEEAMFCYNQLDNVSTATNAWSASTGTTITWTIAADNSVSGTLPTISLGAGVTGYTKVYCSHYNPTSSNPVVVARAIVNIPNRPALEKWLKITLRRRSLFANGLVARNGISWSGHPSADSWNSDPDNDGAGIIAYSSSVRAANCTIGAATGSIDLGSGGDVYGYARTGASGSVSGGSVHGTGSTTNDPTRISNDFSATFPSITVPSPTTYYTLSGSLPSTVPRTTDSTNTDGSYYYVFASGTALTSNMTIGGSVPNKSVVFIFNNHAGVDTIRFSGHDALTINSGSKLTIYTNGNIANTGNGIVNASTTSPQQPAKLIVYGTNSTVGGQSFDVGGNGKFAGALYAPNADVTMHGGGSSGELLGSIIANSITMNGHPDFHYDEALTNLGSGNPFGIIEWRELQTSTERSSYPQVN